MRKTENNQNIDAVYRNRIDAMIQHQFEMMPSEYQKLIRPKIEETRMLLYELIPLFKNTNSQIGGFGPYPEFPSARIQWADDCQRAAVKMMFTTAVAGLLGGPVSASIAMAGGIFDIVSSC